MTDAQSISIHALLAESDVNGVGLIVHIGGFLSTLSLRRATVTFELHNSLCQDFYPRSPCGERHLATRKSCDVCYFYPRSPCGERQRANRLAHAPPKISIHALLAESDRMLASLFCGVFLFLSTLSLRRATNLSVSIVQTIQHFYPRSPCGERQNGPRPSTRINNFYPRSPCGERLVDALKLADFVLFLSTLSLRRATLLSSYIIVYAKISIHALLAESDQAANGLADTPPEISIHALLAESDKRAEHHASSQQEFLSTLSLRRATVAPLLAIGGPGYFYPRSPCGERLYDTSSLMQCQVKFLSTLSLRRATVSD